MKVSVSRAVEHSVESANLFLLNINLENYFLSVNKKLGWLNANYTGCALGFEFAEKLLKVFKLLKLYIKIEFCIFLLKKEINCPCYIEA